MISLIAAMDRHRVIGYKNKLIWHITEDLKHFKSLTQGNIIVMGRNTYESIGKALPNRINVVLTRDATFKAKDVMTFNSIEQLLSSISIEEELFIIGGQNIYEQFLPIADKLYLTHIDAAFYGDTYFPEFDPSEFEIVSVKEGNQDKQTQYNYSFVEYRKIK